MRHALGASRIDHRPHRAACGRSPSTPARDTPRRPRSRTSRTLSAPRPRSAAAPARHGGGRFCPAQGRGADHDGSPPSRVCADGSDPDRFPRSLHAANRWAHLPRPVHRLAGGPSLDSRRRRPYAVQRIDRPDRHPRACSAPTRRPSSGSGPHDFTTVRFLSAHHGRGCRPRHVGPSGTGQAGPVDGTDPLRVDHPEGSPERVLSSPHAVGRGTVPPMSPSGVIVRLGRQACSPGSIAPARPAHAVRSERHAPIPAPQDAVPRGMQGTRGMGTPVWPSTWCRHSGPDVSTDVFQGQPPRKPPARSTRSTARPPRRDRPPHTPAGVCLHVARTPSLPNPSQAPRMPSRTA